MKKFLLLLISFCCTFFVQAQDPFDRAQRAITAPSASTNAMQTAPCPVNKKTFAEDSSFQQLQLVGIIEQNQYHTAIFTDKHQRVIFSQKDDILAQERLQITAISPQQITLFNCQQSQFVYVTF